MTPIRFAQLFVAPMTLGLVFSFGELASASGPLPQYAGSSFQQIVEILRSNYPIQNMTANAKHELSLYEDNSMPTYMPFVTTRLIDDAQRTLNDKADFYPILEKGVHANGICLSGSWEMNNSVTPYTGYFMAGTKALFIGRVSTVTDRTENKGPRTFGFAGKIFPTLDPNEVVKTENFFTIDVLLGARTKRFVSTKLSNSPRIFSGPLSTDWSFLFHGLLINGFFSAADRNPGFRPVTNIAALGLRNGRPIAPKVIEISVAPATPIHRDAERAEDFRNELDMGNFLEGLTLLVKAGSDAEALETIGRIHLDQTYVSYGCDRQLHFAHPKMDVQ